jgi:putative transposase
MPNIRKQLRLQTAQRRPVQKRRNRKAAMKFFKKLLKGQQAAPLKIVTDKLRSYSAAKRDIMPSVEHSTQQDENHRCELSHQPGRQQERQMRRFKSQGQAQRFLSCHGIVNNLFRLGRVRTLLTTSLRDWY